MTIPHPMDPTDRPAKPTNHALDALLVKFDDKEKEWAALVCQSGIEARVAAAVHDFLEGIWPEIKPAVEAGVDILAVAAGAATGPLGPLVAFVVKSFGTTGLRYLVAWLARKTAPGI